MELSEIIEQLTKALVEQLDLGYLVAIGVALGGWIQQSALRRRDERERAREVKRAAYSETVSVLYSYVGKPRESQEDAPEEFWNRLLGLALVAPRPVVSKVLAVSTRARQGLSPGEVRSNIWQVLDSMRDDLGEEAIHDVFENWWRKRSWTRKR